MTFPFTQSEFFSVFARYNEAVWPAQIVLYVLAIVAVGLALSHHHLAGRAVNGILALLWMWMGIVYHATFFAEINPVAIGFAAIFMAQGLFFLALAVRRNTPVSPTSRLNAWAGSALIVVALLLYPMMSGAAGHRYPAQPTFGLPCPTTIFTLGILLWSRDVYRRSVFAIPLLWAAIGTIGAFKLGVPEDLSLALSAVVVLLALAVERGRNAHEQQDRRRVYVPI